MSTGGPLRCLGWRLSFHQGKRAPLGSNDEGWMVAGPGGRCRAGGVMASRMQRHYLPPTADALAARHAPDPRLSAVLLLPQLLNGCRARAAAASVAIARQVSERSAGPAGRPELAAHPHASAPAAGFIHNRYAPVPVCRAHSVSAGR